MFDGLIAEQMKKLDMDSTLVLQDGSGRRLGINALHWRLWASTSPQMPVAYLRDYSIGLLTTLGLPETKTKCDDILVMDGSSLYTQTNPRTLTQRSRQSNRPNRATRRALAKKFNALMDEAEGIYAELMAENTNDQNTAFGVRA